MRLLSTTMTPPSARRSGTAIILILALMSITLGLSYAMLRSQATEAMMQANLGRTDKARQTAQTAASLALQTMHSLNWEGVNTSFSGQLSTNQHYSIQYTVGDSELPEGHADYSEFPYRVTVTVVGTATQPGSESILSNHTIRFVVQLARTHLQPTPAAWEPTQTNTLYQARRRDVYFRLPLRIKGPIQIRGDGQLAIDYPTEMPRQRYLSDLAAMAQEGEGDYRPFDTIVRTRSATTPFDSLVSQSLQVPVELVSFPAMSTVSFPASPPSEYRLYPGGPSYQIPVFSDQVVEDFSFQPDVMNNPLGVLYFSERCRLRNNVQIEGTVLAQTSIRFDGSNTTLTSPTLPGKATLKLPALVAQDAVTFEDSSAAAIAGAVVCFAKTRFSPRESAEKVSLVGPLWTAKFEHQGRQQWLDVSNEQWDAWLAEFELQLQDTDITPIRHFPKWLQETQGLNMQSTVTLERGPANVIHHWTDWTKPLYQADPATGGLHWNIVRWENVGTE